jgi:hypothetical protein
MARPASSLSLPGLADGRGQLAELPGALMVPISFVQACMLVEAFTGQLRDVHATRWERATRSASFPGHHPGLQVAQHPKVPAHQVKGKRQRPGLVVHGRQTLAAGEQQLCPGNPNSTNW